MIIFKNIKIEDNILYADIYKSNEIFLCNIIFYIDKEELKCHKDNNGFNIFYKPHIYTGCREILEKYNELKGIPDEHIVAWY